MAARPSWTGISPDERDASARQAQRSQGAEPSPRERANSLNIRDLARSIVTGAGGPDSVEGILREFYARLASDVLVGFFFLNRDPDKIAMGQASFILGLAGIRDYAGPGPIRAHAGLAPILGGHYERRFELLRQTLEARGLPAELIADWLAFERSFRRP